ncbi:hypothetical protein [Streptomyces virginiae]|uniref:hypothetical protein n=1 Tax=Streptomyces virginiae TaxID=1961 RepID=UPI002250DE53|nr:hypothetical protein [Streptomyces virginiae]MCX5174362.1 hypothetical protein [Streptomyces virginiae]
MIALGYEGAALPIADVFADRAIALSGNQPSIGLLNAVFGKAHTAALRGDHRTTRRLGCAAGAGGRRSVRTRLRSRTG